MKSIIVAFVCVLYCCQAAVTDKDVIIDGKNEKLPAVTDLSTETSKTDSTVSGIPIGPTSPNTTTVSPPTPLPTNGTTTTPRPTTTNGTTTTVTPSPTTTNGTTTTVTPSPTTTNGTTTKPTTSHTTMKPSPSTSAAPINPTTAAPPSNRGFDGPSFIGGIVLASGLMAIGFVALKFYRARTELNYHTL